MDNPEKINFKATASDAALYRAAAAAERLSLSAWIRRALWTQVKP